MLTDIKPYYPVPYRKSLGNKVIKEYDEPFTDNIGNKGIATYVDYINSKGTTVKKYFLRIRWLWIKRIEKKL